MGFVASTVHAGHGDVHGNIRLLGLLNCLPKAVSFPHLMSGSSSRSRLVPSRTTAWSSQRSTLILLCRRSGKGLFRRLIMPWLVKVLHNRVDFDALLSTVA